ncbi:hypothetical protein R6Q59_004893 [Mikania micrantha]
MFFFYLISQLHSKLYIIFAHFMSNFVYLYISLQVVMGTKRAFEEDLQEFIKLPKHFDHCYKPASVAETKLPLETVHVVGIAGENGMSVPDMIVKELEINAPLPLVTGIDASDDDCGHGPVFSDLFSEFFEYNFPRKPLFHFEDVCSSLLNRSPRKEIPIGPEPPG